MPAAQQNKEIEVQISLYSFLIQIKLISDYSKQGSNIRMHRFRIKASTNCITLILFDNKKCYVYK